MKRVLREVAVSHAAQERFAVGPKHAFKEGDGPSDVSGIKPRPPQHRGAVRLGCAMLNLRERERHGCLAELRDVGMDEQHDL